jgi:hypothetical protein
MLKAPIDTAFARLDDFRNLAAHMEKSSGMMMGSKMSIETDELEGRAIGSKVTMHGRMLGMRLSLSEVVIERTPPTRKVWRTEDTDLIVIGAYTLGFELHEKGPATALGVFIDYDLPATGLGRLLGVLFGSTYAKWCTEKIACDAARSFEPSITRTRGSRDTSQRDSVRDHRPRKENIKDIIRSTRDNP